MARFLIIDDDQIIRDLMAMTLRGAGHTVIDAATGREGAALFAQDRPDVVITDVIMPEDGIATVVGLRQAHPNVPFIVVSGVSAESPKGREIAKLLSPRRVLSKPFRLPDLLGVTDEVLAEENIP